MDMLTVFDLHLLQLEEEAILSIVSWSEIPIQICIYYIKGDNCKNSDKFGSIPKQVNAQ